MTASIASPAITLLRGNATSCAAPRSASGQTKGSSLRGLVFALDNVLYDATVWRRWLVRVLGHLGRHVEYASFFAPWDRDYLPAVYRGERSFAAAFHDFLLAEGLTTGEIEELEAAGHSQRRACQATMRPLAGVRSTLAALHRQGFQLAVLTDAECGGDLLHEQLRQLGIDNLFHSVLSSRDLGRTLPDPLCYEAMQEALSLPGRHMAMIGPADAPLAGARDHGWRAFAFNNGAEVVADAQLQRFEELLDLLVETTPLSAAA